ncbi:Tn3 family transposase, partial [Escherichia coli]|nr:Tn3 family transposase [Escherichia coli]MDD8834655.1 Tn3 family transposase [Escherichia coli]MDD8869738.1 Tn3 family transposase [Escherichia coli]
MISLSPPTICNSAGLFWLLGYQFSPRLADAGASVFWRMDHDADYGVLNDIARGQS